MKTRKNVTLLMACLLILSGCRNQISTTESANALQPSTHPTKAVAATEAIKSTPTEKPQESEETAAAAATEAPSTETTSPPSEQKEQKSASEPTKSKSANPAPTKKETEPTKPKSTKPKTKPTVPSTTKPKREPAETAPAKPETEPTKPKPKPTVPESKPTEPAGCSHDWKAIHHKEKGHWKAGIICDCGWTAYGKADELVAKWNAHSASYPEEESLFEHGGYGSADKWVVDEPAYDEWVCRHCGEPKP